MTDENKVENEEDEAELKIQTIGDLRKFLDENKDLNDSVEIVVGVQMPEMEPDENLSEPKDEEEKESDEDDNMVYVDIIALEVFDLEDGKKALGLIGEFPDMDEEDEPDEPLDK